MRPLLSLLALSLAAAACGSGGADDPTDSTAVGAESTAVDADLAAIEPGRAATGQVTIDGTVIDYVLVTPDGFSAGDSAPVLLAMPPGGQNLELTERVTAGIYGPEAIARGWVVLSPAAPDGRLYFDGSETLIPGLIGWIGGWVSPEGGRLHLAGISNGGLSSFRVAARQPDAFHSILAFPGFPRNDDDRAALEQLTNIPIRLFVGENDSGWVTPMEQTAETLRDLGGDVTLDIRAGEGHVMQSLADGVDIFDALDALR